MEKKDVEKLVRPQLNHNPKLCPECGSELVFKHQNILECLNPSCRVIEVRLHHRSNEIIRSAL